MPLPTKEEARFVLLSLRRSVATAAISREGGKKNVILNEVKNPTEELTGHILLTLVVGYFAYAQYDVLFASSIGGSVGEADDRG